MWFVFQQLSCVTTDYGHAAGTVIPPGENGFITFPRLSAASLSRPAAHEAELNGDDRMAANREQSRRPPNSPADYCGRAQNLSPPGVTPVPPATTCETTPDAVSDGRPADERAKGKTPIAHRTPRPPTSSPDSPDNRSVTINRA